MNLSDRILVVPASTTQGMRKVKTLTVQLSTVNSVADILGHLSLSLKATIHRSSHLVLLMASMYEPNQYVMNCGVCDPDAGPVRFSSRISRNLNSGDRLYLVIGSASSTGYHC